MSSGNGRTRLLGFNRSDRNLAAVRQQLSILYIRTTNPTDGDYEYFSSLFFLQFSEKHKVEFARDSIEVLRLDSIVVSCKTDIQRSTSTSVGANFCFRRLQQASLYQNQQVSFFVFQSFDFSLINI